MLERIDAMAVLEPEPPRPLSKLLVNMRVGETLILHEPGGATVSIRLESKHGQGARIEVRAPRSVKITQQEV